MVIFFQLESFTDKTTFNFHSLNKINGFVATQYATSISYIYLPNPVVFTKWEWDGWATIQMVNK